MSFSDIFKSSFLNNYSQAQVSEFNVLMAFVIAAVLGIYIFFFYRFRTRNVFYSKEFAISLVGVTIITAAIIVTIQQSIVVSLGMVGALSIVRFRTAIKSDGFDIYVLGYKFGNYLWSKFIGCCPNFSICYYSGNIIT